MELPGYAACRKALLSFALPLLLALAPCADSSRAETPMDAAAMEALYLERFNSLQDRSSRTGLNRYDPLATVPGAEDWTPLPVRAAADSRLGQAAKAEAIAYAKANRSSALLVWVDGALEIEHYFEGFERSSLIVGKSLAKPLSVLAVGRAMAEGYIESLDEPAAHWFAPWRGTDKAAITLRMLLGNRSGLMPQGATSDPAGVMARAYLHPAHDEVIINDYPLVDPPGSRYEYSNANSELIAPLIRRATGQPYADWVGVELLQPLGARGGKVWMNRVGGTAHSGCCVLLPAESFLRLGLLVLQGGVWEGERLLPPGFVEAMATPSAQNQHAGLGLYLGSPYVERRGPLNPERTIGRVYHSEPYEAGDLVLFDGNSNQVLYLVPSRRMAILRTGDWPPRDPEWDNAKLPNLLLRSLAPGP